VRVGSPGKVAGVRLVGGKALVDLGSKGRGAARGRPRRIRPWECWDNYVDAWPPTAAKAGGYRAQGKEGVSLDQVSRLARDIETDLRDVTRNFQASFGGPAGAERIETMVDNMVVLSQALRSLLEANRAGIDATTNNFREFSAQMSSLVERIDRMVAANQGGVTDTVTNAKELSTKLQATIDNMNAITGKINAGQGSVGQLVSSEETTKNLNDALVAVKEGVNSVTSTLNTVKKFNFDLGIREEYLTGPARGRGTSRSISCPRKRLTAWTLLAAGRAQRGDHNPDCVPGQAHQSRAKHDDLQERFAPSGPAHRLGHWIRRAVFEQGRRAIDYLTPGPAAFLAGGRPGARTSSPTRSSRAVASLPPCSSRAGGTTSTPSRTPIRCCRGRRALETTTSSVAGAASVAR
jgi:hypothetical protein